MDVSVHFEPVAVRTMVFASTFVRIGFETGYPIETDSSTSRWSPEPIDRVREDDGGGRRIYRMYRTILVPTDGSDTANSAIEQAYEIAERFTATVHLLYVMDVDQRYPFDLSTAQMTEAFRAEGENVTQTAADRAPDGLDVVTAVEEGVPHECILEYADERDADLIVTGTHGRRGLDRFLLGSVSERVLRGATVSVLVARPSAQGSGR